MNIYAPSDIEMKYVLNVYDNIADHFKKTRNTVWDAVKDFLDLLPSNQNGIEVGFGNGKNMHYAINLGHNICGIDTCKHFVNICKNQYYFDVTQANATQQIYIDCTFDFAISIAVLHHISDSNMRIKAFDNIINMLKPNGKGLISVWSVEQPETSKKKFVEGDNYVNWNKPIDDNNKRYYVVYKRYYYVYSKRMFLDYLDHFSERIIINKLFNQKGNWFCEFTKKKY